MLTAKKQLITFFLTYLLITICFGLMFWLLYLFNPASFKFSEAIATPGTSDFLYLSAVTITTVGYGDISPAIWYSQLLASGEALLGLAWVIGYFGFLLKTMPWSSESNEARPKAKRLKLFRLLWGARREILSFCILFFIAAWFMGAAFLTLEFYFPKSFIVSSTHEPPSMSRITFIYYALVTMTTVGYGDITPLEHVARLVTVGSIMLGLTFTVVYFAFLLESAPWTQPRKTEAKAALRNSTK